MACFCRPARAGTFPHAARAVKQNDPDVGGKIRSRTGPHPHGGVSSPPHDLGAGPHVYQVVKTSDSRRSRPPLLEALAAEDRTALRGFERNCRLLAALRAEGGGFHLHVTRAPAQSRVALRFAPLAALRFVLEVLVGKKQLLPRGKDEFRAAINALQDSVLVFDHFGVRSL